uniref:Uncharacterized protein n=1 Tax=Siphoviridae sp. ct5jB2 TaxID=2825337 RepID=A0A8S5TTR7_9CAUD|nr:MAG TPA: hypothetical protein [Siphoviridae sp. ct5jB2]
MNVNLFSRFQRDIVVFYKKRRCNLCKIHK